MVDYVSTRCCPFDTGFTSFLLWSGKVPLGVDQTNARVRGLSPAKCDHFE